MSTRVGLKKLKVKQGDPIGATLWDALVDAILERRIIPGNYTRPQNSSGGTAIMVGPIPKWTHPWQATVNGPFAFLATGSISGVEAKVVDANSKKLVPLSNPGNPLLLLVSSKYDQENKSWIAAEVTINAPDDPDAPGLVNAVEIVQCANLIDETNKVISPALSAGMPGLKDSNNTKVRYPLVRLVYGGALSFQVAYFNLQYKLQPPATTADGTTLPDRPGRHFFWPV